MSASCYTNRVKVRTQARNAKVQYPGGRAMYNPIHATCAVNPDFKVLEYKGIPLYCDLNIKVNTTCCQICIYDGNGEGCIIDGGTGEFIYNPILDGGFSNTNSGCILDGGFSNSEYSPIFDGGFSCYTSFIYFDGSSSSSNNPNIIDGGTSALNSSSVVDGGGAMTGC